MNTLSPLSIGSSLTPTVGRVRHQRKRLKEATIQLITFRLRRTWFALPIATVERVIPLDAVYGEAQSSGIGLTVYQGQELLVLDVGQRIFGELSQGDVLVSGETDRTLLDRTPSSQGLDQVQLLLILTTETGQLVGLPIDSRPVLKRVIKESIALLPEEYETAGKIQCVSSLAVQADGEPMIFLLDPIRLLQTLVTHSPAKSAAINQ